MSIPPPVGPSVSAAYGDSKDVFPHKNHRRRHVIDLPHNFETLKDQVDSLHARWKVVHDDINRQSATRQKNDCHEACCNELERILKYYQENIVNRYKKLVGLELGGNQTPVHELSAASKGWKNKFCTPTFYKLARLDKDVLKFTTEVTNLENKITLEHVTSPINPEIVVTQSAKDLTHVPSHDLDSLVDCLRDAYCKRIIIHGEPQVGKTNILRNLNNLLGQRPIQLELDYVIWVTFPTRRPEPEPGDIITDIQDKILQRLGLTGQNGGSGKKEVISRALREKSYLLLFDGFSSSIELEDIGIFEEHEHGKVIIEAKDPYLLRNFRFDKAVKLERLPPQDSRKLFDKIIDDETLCEQNTVLADLIVKELGGLPGVITSVAGQLKINKRVQYWEGMIQRLKADIWDNNLLELAGLVGVKFAFDTAYTILNENDRKCILYAALFPKEFTIPIDILFECWKAEEFLWCPIPTFSHAQGEGACVLKQLIELNLLEKCSEHHVKMPINYRRVALETPFPGEKNAPSFVRSGPEIDGHLKDEEWEMAGRVSLIRSQLEELPASPKCGDMSTLFLQLNPSLRIIEELFFTRMQNLRVLDLHSTGIKLLPPSIAHLTSLRSLYLNNCCDLTVLPPEIVKLKELEVLDIRGTSIHCLPEEISSLFGLRCLRFSFVLDACNPNLEPERTWLIFSPGTADQLNKLEELTIVLVNGSSEGIVNQIETEVLEFKNKNNQFKLILFRPSQSDQGNPSIPASDDLTGNQSRRSDYQGQSTHTPQHRQGSNSIHSYEAALSSYEAACQADPQLQSLDATLQERTSRAINSIAVGLDFRALSLDSLSEVTECLLEMKQEVVNVILQCKKDIWKDQDLYDLVNDYFENKLQSLDFAALEACLKRALHTQSIVLLALQKFEEEHENAQAHSQEESVNPYPKTLQELSNFKATGDRFTQEFFSLFQDVYKQQVLMLERLQAKKRKLDNKLKSMKGWRKVSNVIFIEAFVSVLICSVVAAAVMAPPVVTALAAAAALPLGSMGKWLNSIWSKCERDLKGQREVIFSMQIGNYVVIKDLDSIRVLVDKLQIEIEALLQTADFAMREDEAVVIAVTEINKKVNGFMKTIQDLNDHADKCSSYIRRARAVILRRIINYEGERKCVS
ncbi:probable disease resistance protein At5g47260 [Coffea arabica]|uniref:Probable disease resistance protein At5g47260 n=1 Tax=Coffea arabica TaxID=13443 RepID=A0ABM4X6E3_COFAR